MTTTAELKGLQLSGRARVFAPLLKGHDTAEITRLAVRAPKDAAEALTQLYLSYEEQSRDLADLSVSDFVRDLRSVAEEAQAQLVAARAALVNQEERHKTEVESKAAALVAHDVDEIERATQRAVVAEEKLAMHRQERDEAVKQRDKLTDQLDYKAAEMTRLQAVIAKFQKDHATFAAGVESISKGS